MLLSVDHIKCFLGGCQLHRLQKAQRTQIPLARHSIQHLFLPCNMGDTIVVAKGVGITAGPFFLQNKMWKTQNKYVFLNAETVRNTSF